MSGNPRTSMNVERCLSWCTLAYAHTLSDGHYVAHNFKNINSTDQLNVAALRAGLVNKTEDNRHRVWSNMKAVPGEKEAELLFAEYKVMIEETNKRARARKAKTLRDKAKELESQGKTPTTKPGRPRKQKNEEGEFVLDVAWLTKSINVMQNQLDRIESNTKQLLKAWK